MLRGVSVLRAASSRAKTAALSATVRKTNHNLARKNDPAFPPDLTPSDADTDHSDDAAF